MAYCHSPSDKWNLRIASILRMDLSDWFVSDCDIYSRGYFALNIRSILMLVAEAAGAAGVAGAAGAAGAAEAVGAAWAAG
ncbi:MAG: hypothetical protein FWH33_04490, partial [Oscillospiraceae bacterium]|nr:hypothetical protein [Oscillospiraceae bacterium]